MDLTRIAERLEVRFGTGTNPTLRRALYRRLQAVIEEKGDGAYHVVAECAADALGKEDSGRYFAFAVVRRLRERGILPEVEL